MKPTFFVLLSALLAGVAVAQRQPEPLGRGMVALRSSSSQVYLSWRLLATDAGNAGFNVYRTANNGAPVKLNTALVVNTTDYTDGSANFTLSNAWFVRPVVGGVEGAAGVPSGLPANAPVRQYQPIPLQTTPDGPMDVKFCWVGDLDGDGEYDFVVDRHPAGSERQFVEAYRRDGAFLWRMDMGYNSTNKYNIEPGSSTIGIGHGDNLTVYDLDGDGRAEVLVRTARGVVFADSTMVSAANDTQQFISVLNGMTGVEMARAPVPNPYAADGPLNGHFGIMFCDGLRPSLVFEADNRVGSGSFNLKITTWDYRQGQLTQRWTWDRLNQDADDFHQIRIADVDHDGRDEFCQGSFVIDHDGTLLFTTELVHGDRFHITDIDPSRPGLETFAIQQDNPSMLGMALYEAGTGRMIKQWYMTGIGDVGRGIALDFDPGHRGLELYSTMGGVYDARGTLINTPTPGYPPEGLWWDGDLLRETVDGPNAEKTSVVVNKVNPVTGSYGRLYSIYNEGVHAAYGGRPAFWGDILGDWREELVLVANDFSEIRIYSTRTAATNRLGCLMQNAAYRMQATCKGYYQACYPDFYLGHEMPPPAPNPVSNADLVWRGTASGNWEQGGATNWLTNGVWSSPVGQGAFYAGARVLFDLQGTNHGAVNLSGVLTPAAVTVFSPGNYVFAGAGSLAGGTELLKSGAGLLTLANTNHYTGKTTVAEGPLLVNGTLSASPVEVRGGVWHDGSIGGIGVIGGGVTVKHYGSVSPGAAANQAGVLTISNQLTLGGDARLVLDLSDDPSGASRPSDQIQVRGDLVLSGTNSVQVRFLQAGVTPGSYTFLNYSGALVGGITNLVLEGLAGIPARLSNAPGALVLQVLPVRPPASLAWVGGLSGNAWDLLSTSNFVSGAQRDRFNPGDSVSLLDSAGLNTAIALQGDLPIGKLSFNSASNFSLGGAGRLIGGGSLLKSNSGVLVVSGNTHEFRGPVVIAGGTLAVSQLGLAGEPSSIGASSAAATNLVLAGGTLRLDGDDSYTDRQITLSAPLSTIDIPAAGTQATLVNALLGPGALAKAGAGLLLLNASNSYAGGTVLKAGRIVLGGALANSRGLGTGPVTLEAGRLSMSDVQASEVAPWNLQVPAGALARLDVDGRCSLTGTLTGSGVLDVFTPYVRTDFSGDWSDFSGQINVITDADGGDFRVNRAGGYPFARVSLAAGTSWQNRVGGTPTIPVGELSGVAGSWISAPGGNGGIGVIWRVGGLGTAAAFGGTVRDNVGLVKEGTGTWTLTGANLYTGITRVTQGALVINGNHSAATGTVTVFIGGSLGGTGTIGAPVFVGGRLEPGSPIGPLTFTNTVTLSNSATLALQLDRSLGTFDQLRCGVPLKLAGALVVTNLKGDFQAGDRFPVLEAPALSGQFSSAALPPLPTTYRWDLSRLTVDGSLWVLNSQPPALTASPGSASLTLTAANGTPGWPVQVLSATNAAAPPSHWVAVASNVVDSGGLAAFQMPIETSQPQKYFRLLVP